MSLYKMPDPVIRKPSGWGPRSVAPFYREPYAFEMKAMLDAMMKDKNERVYRFSEMRKKGISPRTLYARINQGLRYLFDHMDPTKRYTNFWSRCYLWNENNDSLHIRIRKEFLDEDYMLKPDILPINDGDAPAVSTRISEWLETAAQGDVFHESKLNLTDEAVHSIQDSFIELDNFAAHVTNTEVKIVKIGG